MHFKVKEKELREWKNITSFLVLESLKRLSVGVGYMNGYSEFV